MLVCQIAFSVVMMQERLAPSAVTHKISTLHPYNTRQQTGLAGQQLTKCEIMPGKVTPTENNCECAQAVMEYLKAVAVTMQLACADAANVNMQMQTRAVRRRKGGREEWGQKFYQVQRGERKKKEQVIVEQDEGQRAGGVLDISEESKPIGSERVGSCCAHGAQAGVSKVAGPSLTNHIKRLLVSSVHHTATLTGVSPGQNIMSTT